MLFGWKKRIARLSTIVLAGAPLHEIDPDLLRGLDAMRGALRGTVDRDEFRIATAALHTPPKEEGTLRHMWEPIELYGWDLAATLYLLDGKPWWLVHATHKKDEPSDKEMSIVRTAVDYLGADPARDCLMDTTFGDGLGYGMWWTWINQSPLLEIHLSHAANATRILPEGSPVQPGWERIDRNEKARPPA